jgi:hypothetical protein
MSIQEVITQVNQSTGSIFTREDVISILQSLELEEQDTLIVVDVTKKGKKKKKQKFGTITRGLNVTINPDQMEDLARAIHSKVEKNIDEMDNDAMMDYETAEFDLNGNEIGLTSVDVDKRFIISECTDGITDVIAEFLDEIAYQRKG